MRTILVGAVMLVVSVVIGVVAERGGFSSLAARLPAMQSDQELTRATDDVAQGVTASLEKTAQKSLQPGAGKVADPWGTPFQVTDDGGLRLATTAGPDKKFGTDDDLSIPYVRR